MVKHTERLRVAFVAGMLVRDGAEKQLVYMARALRDAGVLVRVYHLRAGEFYESVLREQGIELCYIGQAGNPLLRLALLIAKLQEFRPHFVQSGHFWTNLYVGIAARLCRAVAVGGMRNSLAHDLEMLKGWGPWSVRVPHALIANSFAAKRETEAFGIDGRRIAVLQNVIDLEEFDSPCADSGVPFAFDSGPVVMAVGRLVRAKRFDRFIDALATVRARFPALKGLIAGEGPERAELEGKAGGLGLLGSGLSFLGRRNDVPDLLRRADLLMVSSDHEGVPNVILEAMAAGLPVITTPVGDAGDLVQHGVTGYVIPFEDAERRAKCLARLVESEGLRQRLGEAGRRRIEEHHSFDGLGEQLLSIYRVIAQEQKRRDLLRLLQKLGHRPGCNGTVPTGTMALHAAGDRHHLTTPYPADTSGGSKLDGTCSGHLVC
jgi:glycosyltransferase involved in cell wall biosynthesis